jgi:general secretion pathway protein A
VYYEFFNLKEHPFRLTCEAKYFFLGPEHTHANAMMEFALIKKQGMMVLTGEIGTGKTMLLQHFITRLEGNYNYINISQTQLSDVEFLQLLLLELNENSNTSEQNKDALTEQIVSELQQLHDKRQHTVILVDEAQNLEPQVIVRLYELSNLRKDNQRLCTIYLVGQNKLRDILDDPIVREFIANISARYHLRPLDLKDIRKYIYHRLAVAGGHKSIRFTKDVFPIIETYTGGRPRLINVLADHILTYAFTENIKGINANIVDAAIEDLHWLPFGVQYEIEKPRSSNTFKQERRRSYKLVIRRDDEIKGEFLIRDKRINIGRHKDNDLRIDDPLLSRQHAQVIQQGRTIYLRDLNSTNGSYVNSKRVDIAPLEEGTVIKLGNTLLTFLRDNKQQDSEPNSRDRIDLAATQH